MGVSVGHDLVENVVISLNLQLEGDTGLLQKVGLDIGGGDLGGGAEVDTDELTLREKRKIRDSKHGRQQQYYFSCSSIWLCRKL